MWFLIRTAFWFALVLALLPIFSSESTSRLDKQPQVQMSEAVGAATGAFEYMTAMCGEKPEVCLKGGQTLTALGYRAREGARIAYEFLDNHFGDDGKPVAMGNITLPLAVAPGHKLSSAEMQPLPPKPAGDLADAVVTGTIKPLSFVPVPQKRPAS